MADTIAIMNQGVIEQLGAPQEVYDRPASVFVADFIGSPSMNFLPLRRRLRRRRAAGAARRGACWPCPRCARTRRRARCCSACGPSTCASAPTRRCAPRCWAPSTWARSQIVTCRLRAGHDAARQGRRRRAGAARRPASAWPSTPRRCRCSTRPAAARCAPRATTTGRRRARRAPAARSEPPMADCVLEGVEQALRRRAGRARPAARDRRGEFIVLLGPSGAGKTTTLRLVAGLEKPDAGGVHIGGRDVTRARAGAARRDLRVPAVLAVPAPERVRQPGLPAALAAAAHARGRGAAQGHRGGEAAAHRRQARQPGHQAVGRPDAARGDRPRAGARAGGDADGRAAVVARRQAAQRPAAGAQAHPAGPRRDDALRHARPDRGA